MITVFDLTTMTDARPSPYCWRAKLALKHKQLPFDARACNYSDIASIGDGTFKTVPVIKDADRWVGGSMHIANYLEAQYPNTASLFPDDARRHYTNFIEAWVDSTLQPQIFPIVAYDIFQLMPESQQPYFRKTREARLGITLEEVRKIAPSKLPAARAGFEPLRRILKRQTFLNGDAPAYADYIAFSTLKWQRLVSDVELIEAADDPINAWYAKIDRLATQ